MNLMPLTTGESLAEKISGRDDIWYAANIEIFEYAEAYKHLKFSCTGDRVFNSTCYEMFFLRSPLPRGADALSSRLNAFKSSLPDQT